MNLEAAQAGDSTAFERLVEPHRRELRAHCYRLLGSVHDADDALQETLLSAWRGLCGFEGRSSLRSWLYRIATHACLRLSERRPSRVLSRHYGPARSSTGDLGTPITESVFIEPYPDDELPSLASEADPAARYDARESVELAFVAATQRLPSTQRAVVIMRDAMGFSANEVAETLGTTVASVNSALQRARQTVDRHTDAVSQQSTLRALGDDRQRQLVDAYVRAWEGSDVDVLVGMLAEDARFTMPPLPAWYDGRVDVGRFVRERLFATPWRLLPIRANGQLAFACYQQAADGGFPLSAVNILTLRGSHIVEISGFVDPAMYASFGLERFWVDR